MTVGRRRVVHIFIKGNTRWPEVINDTAGLATAQFASNTGICLLVCSSRIKVDRGGELTFQRSNDLQDLISVICKDAERSGPEGLLLELMGPLTERRKLRFRPAVFLLVFSLLFLAGCSGADLLPRALGPLLSTPIGTHTITINATSGSLTRSVTVDLTVQ